MTNIVTKAVPAVVKATGKGTGKVVTSTLGLTTGAGSDAITEAAKVGFERGAAGAPTSASEAFLEAMRNGPLNRCSASKLRQQRSMNV